MHVTRALVLAASLAVASLRPAPSAAQALEAPRAIASTTEEKRALTISGVSLFVTGWVVSAAFGLALGIGFADVPCDDGGLCPSTVAGVSQLPLLGPIINLALGQQDSWVIVQTPLLLAQWAGAAIWIAGLLSSGESATSSLVLVPLASPELVGAGVRGTF